MPDPSGNPSGLFAGRYEIERVLGEGATAIVHRARDTRDGTTVAIKVLREELAESGANARFLKEIRRTTALTHPSIVPVLSSGEERGRPYFVLAYMEAGTLRHRLKRESQLDVHEALAIARSVAEALDHAHAQGLVHRDVKPENILFSQGRARLADFGIARALESIYGDTTSSNVVRGTPAYMSPEQAAGSEKLDGRSDQFSLACVLYEMVAGIPAYVGPNPESVIAQRFLHPPRPIRVYRPSVSPAFEEALSRAFAVQPADRYPTTVAFIEALEAGITRQHAAPTGRLGWRSVAVATLILVAGLGTATATGLVGAGKVNGTTSREASRAFSRGVAFLAAWDLDQADSAFAVAMAVDSAFAQAALRLAEVRFWKRQSPVRWGYAAEAALRQSSTLSPRDSTTAASLVLVFRDDRMGACNNWRFLARSDSSDARAWLGLGTCLRQDRVVLPDSHSPTGWRFRASYNEMLHAHERAFRIAPRLHERWDLDDIRILLMAGGDELRSGQAMRPDTTRFLAYPLWFADSLTFLPQPAHAFVAGRERANSPAFREATARQRRRLLALAEAWRASDPTSVPAYEALAFALDLIGDPTSRDTLARARRLAKTADERVRTGVAEVWTRLKYALPDDTAGIRTARELADSILAVGDQRQSKLLGGLAALTGRAALTARLSEQEYAAQIPRPIAVSGPALLTYASLGGPSDSIHALEQGVAAAVSMMTGPEASLAQSNWIVRAATLAVPVHRFEKLRTHPHDVSQRVRLLDAWNAGSLTAAHRELAQLKQQRRQAGVRAIDVTLDALYAEAALLVALGDVRGAGDWLDPTLDSLRHVSTYALMPSPRAAALVRSMILRSRIATASRDSAARRRWLSAATILWTDADPAQRALLSDAAKEFSP